jgi:Ca2+-binding RTX toxin-like protein
MTKVFVRLAPLIVAFLVLFSSPRAEAVPGCPAVAGRDWSALGVDCAVDGIDVCGFDPGTGVVTCDVSDSDDDAQAIVVSDYDSTTYAIKAWGAVYVGATEELFCCLMAPWSGSPTITSAEIYGSNHADELRFTWTYGATQYSQYRGTNDYVFAGAGSDTVIGSVSGNLKDWLYGETHHDTINALDGGDYLSGGDGPDIMSGGPGNDEMHGGDDSDTMSGNSGDDEMYGDADRDYMNGYDDDDIVDGGTGPDVLCGGNENAMGMYDDRVYDGDSVAEPAVGDVIWGAQSGDSAFCNASNTQWDWVSAGPGTTCTTSNPYFGATIPVGCP